MKTVVHFAKYFPPEKGGIENVTASLSKGTTSDRYSCVVVCFHKDRGVSEQYEDGVKIIRTPILGSLFSQPFGALYIRYCLSNSKLADIVHIHYPNIVACAATLAIPKSTKLVVHWHSDVLNKGILYFLARPLEWTMLCRADRIIVTSKAYADASKALSRFSKKLCVVPIGVAAPNGHKQNHNLSEEISSKVRGKKIVLSVGRLVAYKGFKFLIEAARQFDKDTVVVIAGNGPLKGNLEQFARDKMVDDKVIFASDLQDDELNSLYSIATVYCMPSISRAEAFGVVLLEAMSHGLPVVASDIFGSGVPWVNQHNVTGFNVPPGDSIALAEACNKIVQSQKLREKFSLGSMLRFQAEFTDELANIRMIKNYDELTKF